MKISDIVSTQRRRLGLKQYQLAEKTGIAPSQISIFERGSSGMVTTNLEKVLEALGLHIVYDRQSVQQRKARACAHALISHGIHDLRTITREELASAIGDDDLLLLPVVSDELYRRYCRSEMVDETNTWNHFIKLVHDYMLEEMDSVYDPERIIPTIVQ
jgi:DNA-binding helix-turn-helix protein